MSDVGISFDEFQALEHKVMQAIEIVRREREARAAAEAEVANLRQLLEHQTGEMNEVRARLQGMYQDREAVRLRVENMLRQMDELL